MLSGIFQTETTALESQVAALQAQLAAAQHRISLLNDAEYVAGDSLEALKAAIYKVSGLAPSAVNNLRAAVLNLFKDGTDNDDKGNDPHPAPQPDDDGQEEAITVEILIGQSTEWASPWACPLASPLACVLASTIEPPVTVEENNTLLNTEEKLPYVELVTVSPSVAYQRKISTGEIICGSLVD